MVPCLVEVANGECLGMCEVNPDGTSPQIAPGNDEWAVVELSRVPGRATEKVIDGEIVAKTAEEIAAEKKQHADNAILSIGRLPATDVLRLTHEALWKIEKATGEIPESTTFDEYLQGLAGA